LISPDLTVTNTGSALPSVAGGTQISGTSVAEPTDLAATPSLYYKRDLSHKMAFGLGVNIPHGVSSEYEKDSFARYEATESKLTTVNINPALSWRLNDKLDLGAGLNVQLGTATLARSVDSFLVCANAIGAANCSSLSGPSTAANDGSSTVEATGVAYGINLGAAYHPSANTTISVGLRSATKYELEGDADFDHNATLLATVGTAAYMQQNGGTPPPSAAVAAAAGSAALTAGGLNDRDATADLDLPATASLAFATKMNSKLTLHGDVTWTDWSSVPEIRIEFPSLAGSAALADSVTDLQWEDTVRVGAGMTYQLSDKTKLRAGAAYDPTPTPGPNNRTPRAPRSDSIWLAVGMGHDFSKKLSLDASLAYIHSEDSAITYTSPSATLNYLTRADVETSAISAALSINYKF